MNAFHICQSLLQLYYTAIRTVSFMRQSTGVVGSDRPTPTFSAMVQFPKTERDGSRILQISCWIIIDQLGIPYLLTYTRIHAASFHQQTCTSTTYNEWLRMVCPVPNNLPSPIPTHPNPTPRPGRKIVVLKTFHEYVSNCSNHSLGLKSLFLIVFKHNYYDRLNLVV